jgi:desulfoferrodoxin (superoxide reductase-like protein)
MSMRTFTPATALALGLFLAAPAAVLAGPFDALQTADNPAHTPVITAPDRVAPGEVFDVTVAVGKKPHPSETTHFIRFIALYAGDVQLARAELTPTLTVPTVTFKVKLDASTTLRALAAPNHSAAWVAERPVTVSAP